jgi:hypothetical protein
MDLLEHCHEEFVWAQLQPQEFQVCKRGRFAPSRVTIAPMVRWLRVAFFVAFAAACALFLALWVRSYERWDSPHGSWPGVCNVQVNSLRGYFFLGVGKTNGSDWGWRWRTFRPHYLNNTGAGEGTGIAWTFSRHIGALGFGVVESNGMHSVFMPYWFLTLAAAAGPWAFCRRFGMRTLLLVMTAACLVLGAVAWAVR